jgi:hypothetical protein
LGAVLARRMATLCILGTVAVAEEVLLPRRGVAGEALCI